MSKKKSVFLFVCLFSNSFDWIELGLKIRLIVINYQTHCEIQRFSQKETAEALGRATYRCHSTAIKWLCPKIGLTCKLQHISILLLQRGSRTHVAQLLNTSSAVRVLCSVLIICLEDNIWIPSPKLQCDIIFIFKVTSSKQKIIVKETRQNCREILLELVLLI